MKPQTALAILVTTVVIASPFVTSQSRAATTPAFALAAADGTPISCEDALAEVRRVSATKTLSGPDKTAFEELQAKGIERCNADDDARADTFFGQALDILNK